MRILIAVTAGPHQGQVFILDRHDTFLVGRSKRAHFRLPEKDEFFSRIHFLIEVNPPRCRLVDMKSTNGTFVNGQRVAVADLGDGDLIQGGQTVLRVTVEGDSDAEVITQPWQGPIPAASTLPPAEPVQPAPQPVLSPESCNVCAAVVGKPAPAPAHVKPGSWPLCPSCREQILEMPQPIPGYHLVRELGHGGMGVVYLALCSADGTVLALKTIKPSGDIGRVAVGRFLREAGILRQLEHPSIVAYRDLGEAAGQLYFAMDFVAGTDAGRLLDKQGPWPIARAVGVVCLMLEAL